MTTEEKGYCASYCAFLAFKSMNHPVDDTNGRDKLFAH